MLSPIKTVRAAVIGLALAGATITALPTQAQAQSGGFSFEFNIGGDRFRHRDCLNDRQVRRLVRSAGFNDIRFTDRRGRIVTVRAERGRRDFRVSVDTCRARIVDIDRIRRR